MHFSTAVALTFGVASTLVAAQDKCDAQPIVDTCLAGYQSRIDACQKNGNDYICLCDVYRDVLVCYNNCPDSLERPPVEGTVTSYCNAAEPMRAAASSSMASVASVAATQSHASTKPTASATGDDAEATGSQTGNPFAESTGAAAALGVPAGAALVALLGFL